MSQLKSAAILTCVIHIACSDDPARSVKIVARPPAAAISTSTTPANSVVARHLNSGEQLEFCPPVEDSAGPSSFAANGPCAFQQRAPAACESLGDDFIVALTRKAKRGATVVVYINVEQYHGPGTYDGAQMFVAAQGGTTIYRWSSDAVHAVVGPNEAFLTIPKTQLDGEPVLADCSRLIGPDTNYQFQCGGSGGGQISIETAPELVGGTLQCARVNAR